MTRIDASIRNTGQRLDSLFTTLDGKRGKDDLQNVETRLGGQLTAIQHSLKTVHADSIRRTITTAIGVAQNGFDQSLNAAMGRVEEHAITRT